MKQLKLKVKGFRSGCNQVTIPLIEGMKEKRGTMKPKPITMTEIMCAEVIYQKAVALAIVDEGCQMSDEQFSWVADKALEAALVWRDKKWQALKDMEAQRANQA